MELVGRHFGHIRVMEVVGQGGMGDVYGGYDEKLERKVALKVLNADQRLDDEARERLLREARALSKLDHPNICRIHDYIETGDVDLLVLEYIDGRTLHEAMVERMSRTEKLRIAISIAEVLVQAHRAGIVHRDLKPENVMLTKAGEVKVLDFGLARWLNRAKRASSDRIPAIRMSVHTASPSAATQILPNGTPGSPHPDLLATAAGITLGTPLFMSPEQARGESLTPASDMFSFGLLLQTLFTGKDPHPIDLTAREVILRVARGVTEPVHGEPGDITALLNRLKQFAPADRPTAIEALARLHFLDEKPQRVARRAIVAAIAFVALLGGWRYMADLKRERGIAIEARAEAERRRAQAEDLINFMVGDLRTKLEPVGRLEVLDDAAEKAMQYLGSSKPESLSVQELIAHSKALNQLGEVRMGQGNMRAAMPLFEQSLNRAQMAVQREPKNDDAKFAYGLSRFWMANSYRLQGDIPHAAEHARTYLAVMSDLAMRHPANDPYLLEASYAHSLNGLLLEAQRDFKGAIGEYQKTLAIKNAYAARHPGDDKATEDVARTMNKFAFALQQSGDLRGARRQFETEVALREELVARNPKQMRWKQDLAIAHSFFSTLLENLGETDESFRHRLSDVTLNAELSAFDPANTMWKRNLAVARLSYARHLASRGDLAAAMENLRLSEEALRSLLAADPTRPLWRTDMLYLKNSTARIYLDSGRLESARKQVNEGIALMGDAPDAAARRALGTSFLWLGSIRNAQQMPTEAREAWTKAAQYLRPTDSASAEVRSLELWARVLIVLGRRQEATPVIARLHALGAKNPDFESLIRSEGY
jgi:tetratricopeptide (TPR) repeat protein/tRNA A-37 threonylcarbamoyl transferase component Bud32